MAFDLDAFLKELGATGDEEATLRTALGKPERLTLLEKNQLRQSDYSKQFDALRKSQGDLEAMKTRLDAEAAEWATLSASEKAASTKLRQDLDAHQAKVLTLTQRVQRIAADAGLDPTKALEGIDQPVTPPKKDEPPPFDASKFAPASAFAQMSDYLFQLATEIPALAAEHRALTGQDLDTRALRTEIQKRSGMKGANLDPRVVWEELNQIPTIRETKAREKYDQDLKAAEARGFERARTEASLPVPPSTAGVRSAVLRSLDSGKPHESVLKRPAPEGGVQGALTALRTRKYAEQPPGAQK